VPMDELLLQLCESLRKTMRLHSAEVWTGIDGVYEVAASAPHRARLPLHVSAKALPVTARAGVSGGTWIEIWMPELAEGRVATNLRVAPLAHGGDLLGLVVCERSPDGDPFSRDGDTTLTELSRQVALALHNVNLDSALQASLDELRHKNIELHESRARIVAAGDAERRRLERNLHDGAQQHLVALAVKVRLARDAVEDDPNDAMSLLDELRTDLQDAIAELRALAHGIFPPLLMSGGLVHALPAAAARATLPASVECVDIDRYDQELEAAVYFCCVEAMQNASKHAGEGAELAVRVWQDNGELCFTVTDDGVGFDADGSAVKGHGFVNMADRLGAMQGTLEVSSKPGAGTRIAGRVPLVRAGV
jgi:signal transduction histidine kinase